VKADSFFNFFESIDVSKPEDAVKKADSDDEEEGDEKAEQMDEDFELGNTIKDDLVPLALEYYLGVVEQGEDSDDEDEEGDSDDNDELPKKKKGSAGAKSSAQGTASG
jgi:nucleosome assembly protein 1-like 1